MPEETPCIAVTKLQRQARRLVDQSEGGLTPCSDVHLDVVCGPAMILSGPGSNSLLSFLRPCVLGKFSR